jgi:cellobiose-specific phosphotransferase system component IIA
VETNEAWELVQSALDELAEAYAAVTRLGTDDEQPLFKAETMLLMVRQDELINELALAEQA